MERAVYERMAAQEATHWWFRGRRDIVRRVVARAVADMASNATSTVRILEAGCGTGGNLEMLREFGMLNAFEPDNEAREVARARSGLQVSDGVLPDSIPFSPTPYSIIVMLDVLEHIEDDVAALAALKDRLEPGGCVLVTVPALPFLWSHHDIQHHHYRRYTRASLRACAEQAGFCTVRPFYFNTLLLPLVVTIRGIKRLIGSKSADDIQPNRISNAVLYRIFRTERHWMGRIPAPVGLSLCAVLYQRKKTK